MNTDKRPWYFRWLTICLAAFVAAILLMGCGGKWTAVTTLRGQGDEESATLQLHGGPLKITAEATGLPSDVADVGSMNVWVVKAGYEPVMGDIADFFTWPDATGAKYEQQIDARPPGNHQLIIRSTDTDYSVTLWEKR